MASAAVSHPLQPGNFVGDAPHLVDALVSACELAVAPKAGYTGAGRNLVPFDFTAWDDATTRGTAASTLQGGPGKRGAKGAGAKARGSGKASGSKRGSGDRTPPSSKPGSEASSSGPSSPQRKRVEPAARPPLPKKAGAKAPKASGRPGSGRSSPAARPGDSRASSPGRQLYAGSAVSSPAPHAVPLPSLSMLM